LKFTVLLLLSALNNPADGTDTASAGMHIANSSSDKSSFCRMPMQVSEMYQMHCLQTEQAPSDRCCNRTIIDLFFMLVGSSSQLNGRVLAAAARHLSQLKLNSTMHDALGQLCSCRLLPSTLL
jgi:hypothetical protein